MAMLIKKGQLLDDPWRLIEVPLENIQDYPRFSIIPWQSVCHLVDLEFPQAEMGVWFGIDINLGTLTRKVLDLPLLIIVIEDFSDGRVFSLIKQIRQSLKYQGELRISGDFLLDQMALFSACGVDSFSIPEGSDYEHALFILQHTPPAYAFSATDMKFE